MSIQINYSNSVQEKDLPEPLKKQGVFSTTNPLRAGERNRMFGKTSNLWHKQPTPGDPGFADYICGKELENIAVTLEDIDHLMAVLLLLRNASDYTQKLIGKYMILELHNLADSFASLGRASKDLQQVGQSYRKQLKLLDKKNHFSNIRNKLTAHKHVDRNSQLTVSLEEQVELWKHITLEAISEYYQCLRTHLNQLEQLRPSEFKFNITMNGQLIQDALGSPQAPDYIEFLHFSDEDKLRSAIVKSE